MAAADKDAWERIRGEGSRPYQAFTVYLNQGPERSIARVAQELGKSRSLLARWSVAHKWAERVGAWDSHLARLEARQQEKRVKQASENHVRLSQAMQARIACTLNAMAQAVNDKGKPDPLGPIPRDVPKWVDVAVKIERLGLGMSTQNIEHGGKDGHAIKVELIQQARERLAEKLAPLDEELAQANREAEQRHAAEHGMPEDEADEPEPAEEGSDA